MMTERQTISTERRRSQRLTMASVVHIVSLDPLLDFSGRCNTINVSLHGCQFFITRPFKHHAWLRLDVPNSNRSVTARVVRSMPASPDINVKLWKVGVKFDRPGNFLGIDAPPPDWVL